MLTRNLKSNIHPPKLFHGGWCQPRHFVAVTAKPGISSQTEMRSANRHRFGDAREKAPQVPISAGYRRLDHAPAVHLRDLQRKSEADVRFRVHFP